MIYLTLFFVTLIVLFIIGMNNNIKSSERVFKELDGVADRACEAKTKIELEQLWDELNKIVKEKCWHKGHAYRVGELRGYLKGRYKGTEL